MCSHGVISNEMTSIIIKFPCCYLSDSVWDRATGERERERESACVYVHVEKKQTHMFVCIWLSIHLRQL